MKKNRQIWLFILGLAAVFAVKFFFFTVNSRNSQNEEAVISNKRAHLEYEIRKMIREDSLCGEFLSGLMPAYLSDTIPANQVKWFNENVSIAAKNAFKAKWDSHHKSDSQVLYGILSENPQLCGADNLSDSEFEILQDREIRNYVKTGRKEITPEEVELLCSGIKMPDGRPIFQ